MIKHVFFIILENILFRYHIYYIFLQFILGYSCVLHMHTAIEDVEVSAILH
jgi:hypothetical protein